MDQDIDLSLDDVVEQPLVDEDDRYLVDDEETPDQEKAKAAEAEEARLQALVDRKIADRFMREPVAAPAPRRQEPAPVAPSAPALSEDELIRKMAEELTNEMALNPQEAIRKMLTATRAMNNQASETASERTNRITIENYRSSRSNDPMFKAIAEDFDAEVDSYTPKQLANSTPAQVRKALEAAEDQAMGRYYKKQLADKRSRSVEPPRYSGGRTGGSGNVGPARITAEEKVLVRMAKSSGLSEKDIKELIRENRK
jgi:hypothetical protein